MAKKKEPTLSRNIGSFFGHIFGAIKNDPTKPKTVEVNKTVTEEKKQDGVVLRRTTIDEVVLPPGTKAPDTKPPTP